MLRQYQLLLPIQQLSTFGSIKTIKSDTHERNKHSDAIVHSIGSSLGIALTGKTILEQIADKTEVALGAHLLNPSSHSDASNDTLDTDTINPVTEQAEKPKLKHKKFKQNAESESNVLESRLLPSENEGTLNNVVPRNHQRQLRHCSKAIKTHYDASAVTNIMKTSKQKVHFSQKRNRASLLNKNR